MTLSVCHICKDPIWSFICQRCLARDINKWLPKNLKEAFRGFNRDFSRSFSISLETQGLRCLRCKRIRLASVCPFCYIAEVYTWLSERNRKLAAILYRMLPIAGDWKLGKHGGCMWKDGLIPVSESESQPTDEGTCESCERYSDSLVMYDGRWICRDCESLEK